MNKLLIKNTLITIGSVVWFWFGCWLWSITPFCWMLFPSIVTVGGIDIALLIWTVIRWVDYSTARDMFLLDPK